MRLPQLASVSSSKRGKYSPFGTRTRKKHKRLDAICENAFNQNRGIKIGSNESSKGDSVGNESTLRRSSRVRRTPVILDSSPPPPKKKRKTDKNGTRIFGDSVERMKAKVELKSESSPCSNSRDSEEELASWKSRLRSRVRCASLGMKNGKGNSPFARSKLPMDFDQVKEEVFSMRSKTMNKKKWSDGGKSTIVKSSRPGRIRASIVPEVELHGDAEKESEKKGADVLETEGDDDGSVMASETSNENDDEIVDGTAGQVVEKKSGLNETPIEKQVANDFAKMLEQNKPLQLSEQVKGTTNLRDAEEVVVMPTNAVSDAMAKPQEKHLREENANIVNTSNPACTSVPWKPRIKEGRRCGLCGGLVDGKPPKRLFHDAAGSDHEAYSGSSASEEPNYDIWDGFGDEPGWLGRLLGPINDRYGIAGIWVHQQCAVWSPEVYFAGLGCLKNVRAALCRGRSLKCTRCGRPGATIGCRVDRCPRTYHLPCARANGCIFDHRKFLIACTDHRHLFQPHGFQYLEHIKKLKAKKMKLEMRKLSNDAWRNDLESEEKWLEKCGEDEEFLKRETKRLQRDLLRTAPVYIGGSCSGGEDLFEGWESVAGLQDVIRCMKEVVILPLLYPEFFKNLGLTPPRGVLLHGYPGTGKTLVVRALIGSCARGDKRIAYFARKGADCLGKYVGDAERQLRLLFQVAEKSQPSIIFFDEIDGLAPVRTRHQDQTHSSVVSTLLALMDGLKSRGSVIVIGATNRPDAVDPALRRPGRFDREIYFPLPSVKDRAAILALHTRRWPKPVSGSFLQWIAKRTVGFAGADLQALCAQVAVSALKRHCPLQDILSAGEKSFDGKRPQLPAFVVEERDWLDALSSAPPPCSHREAGMAANEVVGSPLRPHLIPCLLQPICSLLISIYLDDRIWVPPPLSEAASAIKHVIVSAAEQKNLCSGEWSHLVKDLVEESDIENEIVRSLSSAGVLVGEADSYCCNLSTIVCDDDKARFESGSCDSASPGLLRNICYAPKKKEGCRILIAGDPRSGQKHLASCLLQCFVGSVEIKKIDLATISQEGHGDMTQGMTRILLKCASMKICVVFMPRIDLWAIESHKEASHEDGESSPDDPSYDEDESHLSQDQFDGESSSSCPRTSELGVTEPPDEQKRATQTWNSFVEQVASICVSASLIILATSEVPCPALPDGVRRFFGSDSLSSEGSACSTHTSPQITVQVDGRFNQDMVMQSAASELSRNLIGQFVQFIDHRLHSHAKSGMSLKDYCEGENDSAKEPDSKILSSENTTVKVPIVPNSRSVKSKSNLLLAITTFGYQILRYPHFAELCWVTSKLREGPCADISGPWKGWPFNSCLIRPNSSFEKEALACISSNIKGKDKFNLVRGLIAVGLSAYRGGYKSLAEVSFEVRKVLELLVRQISAKIQAGKDRYQFISLLSQVAYLEDMVNSWTYSLRSLELDAQTPAIKPIRAGSPNDHQIWVGDPTHIEGESSARTEGFHEFSEPMEGSFQGLTIENFEHIDLNTDVNNSGHLLNTDKTYALQVASLGHLVADINPTGKHRSLEMESPQKAVSASHAVLPSSTSVDRSGGLTSNEKSSARFDACNPEHYNDLAAVGGVESSRQTNGFMNGESLVHPNIGACSSGEFTSTEPCGSIKVCNHSTTTVVENSTLAQEDESTADVDVDVSLERSTYLSAESGIICSYRCCSGCIYTLHQLVHKIIVKEWEMTGVCWTVEDFHDLVASLSIKLSSAVVKLYNNGGFCSSIEKDLFQSPELDTCPCKIPESNLTIPVECTCHLRSFSSNENSSRHYHLGFDSEFICRDGIFVRADPASEVTFHCKYKTLCLCSLINSIAITKQL